MRDGPIPVAPALNFSVVRATISHATSHGPQALLRANDYWLIDHAHHPTGSASDPVVLRLDNANAVPQEIFEALVECAGFVNWRRLEEGDPAILILAFHRAV